MYSLAIEVGAPLTPIITGSPTKEDLLDENRAGPQNKERDQNRGEHAVADGRPHKAECGTRAFLPRVARLNNKFVRQMRRKFHGHANRQRKVHQGECIELDIPNRDHTKELNDHGKDDDAENERDAYVEGKYERRQCDAQEAHSNNEERVVDYMQVLVPKEVHVGDGKGMICPTAGVEFVRPIHARTGRFNGIQEIAILGQVL